MPGRAIDKLRKAANLKSTRRLVVLDSGEEFEFWSTPLTMAQREKPTGTPSLTTSISLLCNCFWLRRPTNLAPSCSALATLPF